MGEFGGVGMFAQPVVMEEPSPPVRSAGIVALGFVTDPIDQPAAQQPPQSPPLPPLQPDPPRPVVAPPAVAHRSVVVENTSRTDLLVNDSGHAGWEAVRDYVVSSIEKRWGPFPRNPVTEASIFKSFVGRWGDRSMAIAEQAVLDGCMWAGAPLSVNRFCKGSDEFFAAVIAARLDESATAAA